MHQPHWPLVSLNRPNSSPLHGLSTFLLPLPRWMPLRLVLHMAGPLSQCAYQFKCHFLKEVFLNSLYNRVFHDFLFMSLLALTTTWRLFYVSDCLFLICPLSLKSKFLEGKTLYLAMLAHSLVQVTLLCMRRTPTRPYTCMSVCVRINEQNPTSPRSLSSLLHLHTALPPSHLSSLYATYSHNCILRHIYSFPDCFSSIQHDCNFPYKWDF